MKPRTSTSLLCTVVDAAASRVLMAGYWGIISAVRNEPVTLFGNQSPRRGPREYGAVAGCLVFMPLLAIAAVLSVPYGFVWKTGMYVKAWLLRRNMVKRKRIITWEPFVEAIDRNLGTLICERDHSKAPTRWWWTRDDIYRIAPFPFGDSFSMSFYGEFLPFRKWCFEEYTSPQTGRAVLVLSTDDQKHSVKEKIYGFRVVEMVPPREPRQKNVTS